MANDPITAACGADLFRRAEVRRHETPTATIAYRVVGAGPPLVLVHGWPPACRGCHARGRAASSATSGSSPARRLTPPLPNPLWAVLLAGAAFLYLWWLAVVCFDLIYVWHHYVRGSVRGVTAAHCLGEICQYPAKGE